MKILCIVTATKEEIHAAAIRDILANKTLSSGTEINLVEEPSNGIQEYNILDERALNELLRIIKTNDMSKKISAIKSFRQLTGCDLLGSKNAIQAILR